MAYRAFDFCSKLIVEEATAVQEQLGQLGLGWPFGCSKTSSPTMFAQSIAANFIGTLTQTRF